MNPGHTGNATAFDSMQRHRIFLRTAARPASPAAGFTLIEMLIAIAVLGILLGIAVPSYHDYVIRARVAEGVQMATAPQLLAADDFLRSGNFAAVAASYNFPAGGSDYVNTIAINPANGAIRVTTRNTGAALDPVIDFIPATAPMPGGPPGSTTGLLTWTCFRSAGEARHVPRSCATPSPLP